MNPTTLAQALLEASEHERAERAVWLRVGKTAAAAVLDAEERLWSSLAE